MISYLYVVHDKLSNSYGSLIEYRTDGAAIRDFKKMFSPGVVQDPSQYELVCVAKVERADNSISVLPTDSKVIYNYTAFVADRVDSEDDLSKLVEICASLNPDYIKELTRMSLKFKDELFGGSKDVK